MKKLLPLLLLILIGCSEPEPLNYQLLIKRDGVHYRLDNNKIYSGPVFTLDNQGKLLSQMILKDGIVIETKYIYPTGEVEILIKIQDNIKTYHFFNMDGSEKKPINIETMLIQRKDVFYTKDTNQPYSGPVFSLYDNGQLELEGTIKDGKEDGPWKLYYENGQLNGTGSYKDGIKDGPYKSYYENGQLELEGTIKDGKIHGPYIEYYENGQLNGTGSYKDGIKDGLWKYYYENGQIEKEVMWKDGEIIDIKKY